MKAVTVKELKTELNYKSHQEIIDLCLQLSKFKKENKELLTYLLFEADNQENFINSIKKEIDAQFDLINTKTFYFIKKSVRKILRRIKTYIRYSKNTEIEVELRLYFCYKLKNFSPPLKYNTVLNNLYIREIESIKKKITTLHQDLQYDYNLEIQKLIL